LPTGGGSPPEWGLGEEVKHTRDERWRSAAAVVLLAAFLALDLRVALYHLATEGWKSGLTEVGLALVVASLASLGILSRRRHGTAGRRLPRSAAAALSAIAVFFVFLSAYHFTHQGVRSGAVELSLAAILLLLALALR